MANMCQYIMNEHAQLTRAFLGAGVSSSLYCHLQCQHPTAECKLDPSFWDPPSCRCAWEAMELGSCRSRGRPGWLQAAMWGLNPWWEA